MSLSAAVWPQFATQVFAIAALSAQAVRTVPLSGS